MKRFNKSFVEVDCARCAGTGEGPNSEREVCHVCHGSGIEKTYYKPVRKPKPKAMPTSQLALLMEH